MSIVQVQGGGGRVASDRTSFVGARVPPEIKAMIKPLNKLDKNTFRKVLKLVVQSLEDEVTYSEFKAIVPTLEDATSEEILGIVFAGLLCLVKCGLRHTTTSLKQQHFKEDLDELGISSELHSDLASCVFGTKPDASVIVSHGLPLPSHPVDVLHIKQLPHEIGRAVLDQQLLTSRPRLPQLSELKWRVDVAISTSVLNRVLEPSILMEMTLSNGQIKVFEVPVSQFHQLRYNVAYVLKQMEDLEKRSILKIQD